MTTTGRARYEGATARAYAAGRGMSARAAATWRAALRYRAPGSPRTVVDLGAGTGRFDGLLAELGPSCRVLAVEPAAAMRTAATARDCGTAVRQIGGQAEAIPLAGGVVDVVGLFFVLHHLEDVAAAAREIARVLRPGGRLLMAGSFGDRLHPRTYHHYMPSTRSIEAAMYPARTRVERLLAAAGLAPIGLDEVDVEVAPDLASYHRRLAHGAVTPVAAVARDEHEAGMSRLRRDAAGPGSGGPVRHLVDLSVHERREVEGMPTMVIGPCRP